MLLTPARPALSVALCPDQVGLVWRAGRVAGEHSIRCVGRDAAPAWQAPLDALLQWMGEAGNMQRARMRVVLSSRFVRYVLVPWPTVPLQGEEAVAWDRMHLEAAYGDLRGWRVVCASGAFGRPRVACAAPQDLLDRLQSVAASQRLTASPVVPCFVRAWNHWRHKLAAGQLFVAADSERVVMGRHGLRGWDGLRMVSAALTPEALVALVRREQALAGAQDALPALVFTPGMATAAGQPATDQAIEWVGLDGADGSPALSMARLLAHP